MQASKLQAVSFQWFKPESLKEWAQFMCYALPGVEFVSIELRTGHAVLKPHAAVAHLRE